MTNVTVIMTTYNRKKLFRETITSLYSANTPFRLVVIENHSSDGTQELAEEMKKDKLIELLQPEVKLPMLYQTQLIGIDYVLKDSKPDLILLTADDFKYKPEWLESLMEWYSKAPANIAFCSLYKEPDWWWNEIYSTIRSDRNVAFVRRTVPGACWTLRLDDWRFIELKFREWAHDGQLDVNMCEWIYKRNKICCALDLAEHSGAHESLYGNISYGPKPKESVK